VCDQPHPLIITQIVEACTKGQLETAYENMKVGPGHTSREGTHPTSPPLPLSTGSTADQQLVLAYTFVSDIFLTTLIPVDVDWSHAVDWKPSNFIVLCPACSACLTRGTPPWTSSQHSSGLYATPPALQNSQSSSSSRCAVNSRRGKGEFRFPRFVDAGFIN
jgi:hypothetical protein